MLANTQCEKNKSAWLKTVHRADINSPMESFREFDNVVRPWSMTRICVSTSKVLRSHPNGRWDCSYFSALPI